MNRFFSNAKLKRYLVYAAVAMAVAMTEPLLDWIDRPDTQSGELLTAWEQRQSKVWVTVEGRVLKNLRDDNEGSRHQRFLSEAGTGESILVAHSIDLADRAPVQRGDTVGIRGRYEWNDRGGVIHWTHHDPSGRLRGGWLEVDGTRYR